MSVNGVGTPAEMTPVVQKQVKVQRDQALACFTVAVQGLMMEFVSTGCLPPHEIADQLMQRAAYLLGAITDETARQNLVAGYLRNFPINVETNALAHRTTKGGVIMPDGGRA